MPKNAKRAVRCDIETLRTHALKLLRDARKRGKRKQVNMSLTVDDIILLYKKQRGRCALSGAALLCGAVSLCQNDAMSLDRCVPKRGYQMGNVQLLTRAVNNAKSTMLKKEFVAMCTNVANRH